VAADSDPRVPRGWKPRATPKEIDANKGEGSRCLSRHNGGHNKVYAGGQRNVRGPVWGDRYNQGAGSRRVVRQEATWVLKR
jgi:hypothetical protein